MIVGKMIMLPLLGDAAPGNLPWHSLEDPRQ